MAFEKSNHLGFAWAVAAPLLMQATQMLTGGAAAKRQQKEAAEVRKRAEAEARAARTQATLAAATAASAKAANIKKASMVLGIPIKYLIIAGAGLAVVGAGAYILWQRR